MNELHSLLHSLTSAEWAAFRNYLTCFTTYNKEDLKQVQLAEMLMQENISPTHAQCCIQLYGTRNAHEFDDLKYRLKEKTLDFLLTDISCDKKKELDEADYAIIKIKKKSAQFQHLFYSKKRIHLLYGLLDEIISLAKEYEHYSSLAEHLRLKKAITGPKSSQKEFEKISKEMNYYSECSRMINQAEQRYYELIILLEYSGKPAEKKLSAFFENAIGELDGYYQQTKSPLIKYHRKFLELGFYLHKKSYTTARTVCLELLGIVRSNKSVYRRQRIGVVYDNLSRCECYLGNFQQAIEWAQHAQKQFNAASENYCIALEQEFYALFALKQYEPALALAERMLSSATEKELGKFRYAKYQLLRANALFQLRRFTQALNILSQEWEISKDKEGWETGLRVLKIMTLLEMKKESEATLNILALKQFFKRMGSASPRDKIILNLLMQAQRAGFMFNLLNGVAHENIAKLSPPSPRRGEHARAALSPSGRDGEGLLSWQPFTPEVIPFHQWFASRMPAGKKKTTEKEFAQES
ncbi:MAG: hypothetical protein HY063_03210 [Bacteroidetes bacterium]|nr:hypothetical protein [Bacteroidota bacterium]